MIELFRFDTTNIGDSLEPPKIDEKLFLKLLPEELELPCFFDDHFVPFFQYQFDCSIEELLTSTLQDENFNSETKNIQRESPINMKISIEDTSPYIRALGGLSLRQPSSVDIESNCTSIFDQQNLEVERIVLVCGSVLNSIKHFNMKLAENVMIDDPVLSRFHHFMEEYLCSYELFIYSKFNCYDFVLHLYNDLKKCLVVFFLFGSHICSIFEKIFSCNDTCSATLLLIRLLPSNSTNLQFKSLCDQCYEYVMEPIYKCVYYWINQGRLVSYPFFFIKKNETDSFNWYQSYTLVNELMLPEFCKISRQIFNVGKWKNFINYMEGNLPKNDDVGSVSFDEISLILFKNNNLLKYVVEKTGFVTAFKKFGMIAETAFFDMQMLVETGFCSHHFGCEDLYYANLTVAADTYEPIFDIGMADPLYHFVSEDVIALYKKIWRVTFIPPFVLFKISKVYFSNFKNPNTIAMKTCFLLINFWTFIGNYVGITLKNCFSDSLFIENILKCSSLEEVHTKHITYAESVILRLRIGKVFEERIAELAFFSVDICHYAFNKDEEKTRESIAKFNYILVQLSKDIGGSKELMHIRDTVISYIETIERLEESY